MKKLIVCTICLFLIQGAWAQEKKMRIKIYFEKDRYELTDSAQHILDQRLKELSKYDIGMIKLKGNTDSDADSLYNIRLSEKRTEATRTYLLTKGIEAKKISSRYVGENQPIANNNSPLGMQKNRRVDITIYYTKKRKAALQETAIVDSLIEEKPEEALIEKDSCKGDTMIRLDQGTLVILDKCDAMNFKNCIEIQEFNTVESMVNGNQNLRTESGGVIVSSGMINLTVKAGCPECYNKPVKFLFPVDKNPGLFGRSPNVWTTNENGAWITNGNSRKDRFRTVSIKGKKYYEYEIQCPVSGKINADVSVEEMKIKLKLKDGLKFENAIVAFAQPNAAYNIRIKKLRKHIAKDRIACIPADAKYTKVWVLTPENEKIESALIDLTELRSRRWFTKCGFRERKYIIRYENLVP